MFCTQLLPEMVYPNNLGHNFGYYFFSIQLVHRQEIKKHSKHYLCTIHRNNVLPVYLIKQHCSWNSAETTDINPTFSNTQQIKFLDLIHSNKMKILLHLQIHVETLYKPVLCAETEGTNSCFGIYVEQ